MRSYLKIVVGLTVTSAALSFSASNSFAVLANDNSGNYVNWFPPTPSPANGGSGFTAWNFQRTSGDPNQANMFLGSATDNNSGDPQNYPAINVAPNTDSFGIFAKGDGGANNQRAAA